MNAIKVLVVLALLVGCSGRAGRPTARASTRPQPEERGPKMTRIDDAELRSRLTAQEYHVTQQCGTEPPFTGKYWNEHRAGRYRCVACGQVLFDSQAKFDSGSGWPSYTAPAGESAVTTREDRSHGMVRVEVMCSKCGAHLGHVFEDGPEPTGPKKRFCINSAAMRFEPSEK